MTARPIHALGALALLLGACVPSVYPFYTDDDVRFETALLGEWLDGDAVWAFERIEELPAYGLTITENDKTGVFWATLFTLGDEHFLDLMPVEVTYTDDELELVKSAMISGHLALHVRAIEPALEINLMDPDWVGEYLEEHPRAVRHRREGERVIFTDTTRALQRFLRRYLDQGLYSDDYSEMERAAAGD